MQAEMPYLTDKQRRALEWFFDRDGDGVIVQVNVEDADRTYDAVLAMGQYARVTGTLDILLQYHMVERYGPKDGRVRMTPLARTLVESWRAGGADATLPKLAISIRQPWAHLILNEGKDIENRQWKTPIRGAVCIHAAKAMTKDEYADADEFVRGLRLQLPGPRDFQFGGIVGVADIVDCVSDSKSRWFFGRYGFVLRNVRAVNFIPCKGALGFFDWRERGNV